MRTLGLLLISFFFLQNAMAVEDMIPTGSRKPLVVEIGSKASKELKTVLKSNLQKEMKAKGPVGAMQFCANHALELTDQVNQKMRKGTVIKRVSQKYRNPTNQPDSVDEKVFAYFKMIKEKKGEYPNDFIIRIRHKQNKNLEIYRYYEPLVMDKPCLACHGENLSEDVKKELAKLYPNDLATGYKMGELRGLISVEVHPDVFVIKK